MKSETYTHGFRLKFNGDRDSRTVSVETALGRNDLAWSKVIQKLKDETKVQDDAILWAQLASIEKVR